MKTPEQAHAEYVKMKADGAYCGSKKDASWDRALGMHTCCKSKKAVYHRSGCPTRSLDLSDIRIEKPKPPVDPESSAGLRLRVQQLKAQDLTSGQVYAQMQHEGSQISLAQVNKLWV